MYVIQEFAKMSGLLDILFLLQRCEDVKRYFSFNPCFLAWDTLPLKTFACDVPVLLVLLDQIRDL